MGEINKQIDKMNIGKDNIRLYTITTLAIWKGICDDLKNDKKKKEDLEKKTTLSEELEKAAMSNKISLIEDEDLKIEEIANDRKEDIEKLKDTIFKKKYEEYKNCENELKTDLDAIKKELTTIYDECDKVDNNEEYNKILENKKAELEISIDSLEYTVVETLTQIENKNEKIEEKKTKLNQSIKNVNTNVNTNELDLENITQLPAIKTDTIKLNKYLDKNIEDCDKYLNKLKKIEINKDLPENLYNFKYLKILNNEIVEKQEDIKTKKNRLDGQVKANAETINTLEDGLQKTKIEHKNLQNEFDEIKEKIIKDIKELKKKFEDIKELLIPYEKKLTDLKTLETNIEKIIGQKIDVGIINDEKIENIKRPLGDKIIDVYETWKTNLKTQLLTTTNLYKKINERLSLETTDKKKDIINLCENINTKKDTFEPEAFEKFKNDIFADKYFKYKIFDKKNDKKIEPEEENKKPAKSSIVKYTTPESKQQWYSPFTSLFSFSGGELSKSPDKKSEEASVETNINPYTIEDIFNKDKKYEKNNFFLLTQKKQTEYKEFSNFILKLKNDKVANNYSEFLTKHQKKQTVKNEDNVEERDKIPLQGFLGNNSNWIDTLIDTGGNLKNDKKWLKIKKKLKNLDSNIKKNIEALFEKRFSLVRLIYFEIKKTKNIIQWIDEKTSQDEKNNIVFKESI